MRTFSGNDNIEAPSADYPKGRSKDRVGTTPGTTSNERLNGDIQQFFQKLVIDAQISENELPDNVTNGYQLLEALVDKIQKTMGGVLSKKIDIGTWNMDADGTKAVAHGLDATKIVSVNALILPDESASTDISYDFRAPTIYVLPSGPTLIGDGETGIRISDTNIVLYRKDSSFFDNTIFDSTLSNRGFIIVQYVL